MTQLNQPEERYYVPVKDQRPKGSRWKAILDEGKEQHYIQVGSEDNPQWIELGRFYEMAFLDSNQSFIDDCVILYDRQLTKKAFLKKLKEEANT